MKTVSEQKHGLKLHTQGDQFTIELDGRTLLKHSPQSPCVYVGQGEETMDMYRGNFHIEDYVIERSGLRYAQVTENQTGYEIELKRSPKDESILVMQVVYEKESLRIQFDGDREMYNRFWIRIHADNSERVYGCGQQMSHLNLRGKHFPLWTSEPGVGRNKSTYTTWQADVHDKAGGDYYHTNYPQPTYLSTRKYFCHVETTAYADFDFRNDDFHELQVWEIPEAVLFESGETYKELVGSLTSHLGRQPELPEWTYDGIWLGMQGGTEKVQQKIDEAREKGIKVGAVWAQDWQGKRVTSFGRRLNWDWKWDENEYPDLDVKLKEWKAEGIRLLGYINPYLVNDGTLYKEAVELGYLVRNQADEVYLVDFGEFDCGIVDLTHPEAFQWYKEVIQANLIDFGLDGWMADFGEYLPTDAKLHNQVSAKLMHNAWPMLWAKVNFEAVAESERPDDLVYFMRAGHTGSQKYCHLLWAGDQSVNWDLDDGIASVIPAALSAGLCGNGLHHSDIGGYTSLHGNKRTKELLLRWLEMAAFTSVMRSHEGNRPNENYQYDQEEETMQHFARMTDVHVALAPYLRTLVKENAAEGIPVQRPLFMEYEEDERTYELQYQYMLGEDVLVAPVYEESATSWSVYLPEDEWVHLWSGESYSGGTVEVAAGIGEPPVFYRKGSAFKDTFESIRQHYAWKK
ncbi:alpha-glucosidase [Halobacillus sp. ACCC02827]|uniref:alpha-glucosidase n=1 Tax=Halobacillus sp. ACCC02827 TaxID=3052090 RepID=UPI00256FFD4C|nr:alpha-glucosidase [Halobacillus sp. ACCC02827]WJE15242.1 alpha-glucosidase [Halobacillus sp. ACCC02827]